MTLRVRWSSEGISLSFLVVRTHTMCFLTIFAVAMFLPVEGGNGGQGLVLTVEDDPHFPYRSLRSWVQVKWDSGETNKYRRGHEGSVDIKCVTPALGELYYRDHLPKLGNHSSLPAALPEWTVFCANW